MASSYLNSFGFSELLALSRMISALRDGPQQVVAPPGYVLTSWRDYKANAKPGDVLFLSSSRNFSNWSAPVRPDEVDESFTCLYAKRAEGVDLCAPNSDYATCTANVASYPKDKVKPFDPPVPSGYMSCPVSEISESSNREDYLLLNPFTFRWEAPVFGLLAYVRQGHTKRFAKRCSALQSPASPMVTAPPIPVGYVASTPLEYNLLAQSGNPTFKWWLPGTGGWQLPANPNRGGSRSAKHGFKCIRSTSSMVVGLPMEPAPPLAIPEGYEPCTVEEYRREARRGVRTYLYTRTGKTEWLTPRASERFGVPRPGLRTIRLVGNTFLPGSTVPAGYKSCSLGEYRAKAKSGDNTYLKTSPELRYWYVPANPDANREIPIADFESAGVRACKRMADVADYPPVPKGFISCTAEFFKANGKRRDASWLRCGRGENWRIPQVNPSCINPKCARINGTQFCYRPALVPPSPSVTAPSAPKTPVTTFGPDGFAVVPEGYVIATRADFIDSSCKPNPPAHLDQSKWQMARVGEPWRPYKKADSTDGSFGFGELHIIRPSAASPLATVPTATLPTPPVRPWTVPPKVGTVLRSRETKVPWIVTAWSQTNGTVQLAYPKSTGGHVSNVLSLEQVCSFLEQADGSPAGEVDPWWNPDNLTAEQLGAAGGFRFVTQSEVDAAEDGRIPGTEWWNAGRGWYVGYGPEKGASAISDSGHKFTLRTKAPLPSTMPSAPLPPPPVLDELWNPAEVPDDKVGTEDGWRLLTKSEAIAAGLNPVKDSQWWSPYANDWVAVNMSRYSNSDSYGKSEWYPNAVSQEHGQKATLRVKAAPSAPKTPPTEWHNPFGLTPEQVGTEDGWRLLTKDEVWGGQGGLVTTRCQWSSSRTGGDFGPPDGHYHFYPSDCGTFRTRAEWTSETVAAGVGEADGGAK